jgi:hypothetical protein
MGFPRANILFAFEDLFVILFDAVHHGHFVSDPCACPPAGAVVADDVNDQRVIELAQLRDCIHDPAHVVVRLGKVAGVHLHHVGKELLLLGVE